MVRTNSVGYCPTVPLASIRIPFQHRPMAPALATASLQLLAPHLTAPGRKFGGLEDAVMGHEVTPWHFFDETRAREMARADLTVATRGM